MRVPGLSGAGGSRRTMLPALFAILLAIVFWMSAESARERLQQVEMQIGAAQRLANRTADRGENTLLQASLEKARAERNALTARLRTTENPQMIRAKIVYDLRQKCAATGAAVCAVRLADDTIAAVPTKPVGAIPGAAATAPAGSDDGRPKLIDLGIQKARAIISGSFQNDEPARLGESLNADPGGYWRINGLTIRGTTFEFDVERHMITATAGGS